MSFLQLPLTTDTDAPLPSGVGYDVSQEQHQGCPRGGWLAVEIEPMTGASVEVCTACRHRRVFSMTTATAEALRAAAEQEAVEQAGKTVPPALLALMPPKDGAPPPRLCERPECDRIAVRRFCSPACSQAHRRKATVARQGGPRPCECLCGAMLTIAQARYASRECAWRGRRMEQAGRYGAQCEDCPATFERSTRSRGAVRCPACQRAAHRRADKAREKEIMRLGRLALAAEQGEAA